MSGLATPHETVEDVRRLALGIEPIDRVRRKAPVHPVRIDIERGLPHTPKPPINRYCFAQSINKAPETLCRHFSGRYTLRYYPSLKSRILLRIYDHHRYYVPRRLIVPLLTEAAVKAIEEAEQQDYYVGRVRHPVLFPGAAYDVQSTATGLRGRVLRDGKPMRWCYIEGRLTATGALVGRARGDDRGEFLLLLAPSAVPASDLSATTQVRITLFGPATAPVPTTAELPAQDPLWDLPSEQLPNPGEIDEVSAGNVIPIDYVQSVSASRDVACRVGRIFTGVEVDDFVFSVP